METGCSRRNKTILQQTPHCQRKSFSLSYSQSQSTFRVSQFTKIRARTHSQTFCAAPMTFEDLGFSKARAIPRTHNNKTGRCVSVSRGWSRHSLPSHPTRPPLWSRVTECVWEWSINVHSESRYKKCYCPTHARTPLETRRLPRRILFHCDFEKSPWLQWRLRKYINSLGWLIMLPLCVTHFVDHFLVWAMKNNMRALGYF